MYLAMIGPWQLFISLVLPFGIFMFGYFVGKKAGYIKRVKEEEAQRKR
ncbi:hypothetical protein [Flagellimonas beolgyonensis]